MAWRNKYPSGPTWEDIRPWVWALEHVGYRVRVVISLEQLSKLRVSVTLALPGVGGRWEERLRQGGLVSTQSKGAIERMVLQSLVALQQQVEAGAPGPDPAEAAHIEPLPEVNRYPAER